MKHFEKLSKTKLGEILVSEGVITKEQLDEALADQERQGGKLGEVLIALNYLTEMDIAKRGPRVDKIDMQGAKAGYIKLDLLKRSTEWGFSLYEVEVRATE